MESDLYGLFHCDIVQLFNRHDQKITLDEQRSLHSLLVVFKESVKK